MAPAAGELRKEPAFAAMSSVTIDAGARRLRTGRREGAGFTEAELAWEKGALVEVRSVLSISGAAPHGKRVDGTYEEIRERRGGRLVVVRRGVRKPR